MMDDLIITRFWQDADFFQVEIQCKTEFIVVTEKVYTTDALIDDLYNKLELFLSGKSKTVCWQNGTIGDATTPCIRLQFLNADKVGHVLVEVFMEIDDGGALSTHNCCFYLNTEIGLLYQFKEKLQNLKKPQLGVQIVLNKT